MNILGIIPARGGSKRISGKNKKLLGGKPLVEYAIQAGLESTLINEILLTSDDLEILKIGESYPSIIKRVRPFEISGDQALAISYVQDALAYMETDYDMIAIIQPSSPFTTAFDIDSTIKLLQNFESADSAVSVMKLDHVIQPAKIKKMENKVLIPYFEKENNRMAEHELPELYVRNGSVYVSRISTIKKNRIIGDHCLGYEMPRERSLDINDPIDFEFAKFLFNNSHEG
ncbi:acylneuraminate cytidylyltransferase family protein [Portibacter marinus]|uniref:acylneuraminate cytidylyltransferase family protein n=1 Tax=Portibacter marinus TaxID=2898660 RepID=UPI001F439496|nr:acylneuraminate cytidylyltransferase family protein [Portibacter marinus]